MMLNVMKIFKNKKNIIKFICEHEHLDYIPKPIPASKMLPQWYKDMPSYVDNIKIHEVAGANATIKKCMPIFDTMTTGYFIVLPCDVYISKDINGMPSVTPSFGEKMVSDHSLKQAITFDIPKEYHKQLLKWTNFWKIKTPKGWSVMFVQPMHRDDLPFQILPGIVDTDEFVLSVQFPFLLRKDFEGTLPKGTPIAQVIPFKRENWEAEYGNQTSLETKKFLDNHSSIFENRYKKTSWKKKTYK